MKSYILGKDVIKRKKLLGNDFICVSLMYISIRHDITKNSGPHIYIITYIYDVGLLSMMYMIHDFYRFFLIF